MSIVDEFDCSYCLSSPCICSDEDIRRRIDEEDQLRAIQEYEDSIESYLNR